MLEARNLTLRLSERNILENFSVSFQRGEISVITGPNGSGKSVLLHSLAGLLVPQEGEIVLDGNAYPGKTTALGTGVGLVFQQPELQIIEQSVEEDILFGLQNLQLPADEIQHRLEHALQWSSLAEERHKNPQQLSGGELRRLALASVIAMGASFVLLDEPFENLDYPSIRDTLEQILKLKESNCGVIIVTHGLEKCLAHADRLVLLKDGRIIADALPERVLPYLEDHGVRRPGVKIQDMSWLKS